MVGENKRTFSSLEEAKAAAARKREQKEQHQENRKKPPRTIEIVDLLSSSDDEVEASTKTGSLPIRQDTTRSYPDRPQSFRETPLQIGLDGYDGSAHGPQHVSRKDQHHSATQGSYSRNSNARGGPHPVRSHNPTRPPASGMQMVGRKPPTTSIATTNSKAVPMSEKDRPARYNIQGQPSSTLPLVDQDTKHHETIIDPGNPASLPSSEMEPTGPRTPNPLQFRYAPVASVRRIHRNSAAMGASRSTLRNNSGQIMVKLGAKDKRRSFLSGRRREVLELSENEELPLLSKQCSIPLPTAMSKVWTVASTSEDDEPDQSSHEVISIADSSDEEVPVEAFSPVNKRISIKSSPGPPVEIVERVVDEVRDSGNTTPVSGDKSPEKPADSEDNTGASIVGTDLAIMGIEGSRTRTSLWDIGDSQVHPAPSEHSEIAANQSGQNSAVEPRDLEQSGCVRNDCPLPPLAKESTGTAIKAPEEEDTRMNHDDPLLFEQGCIQDIETPDSHSENDAGNAPSDDDCAVQGVSLTRQQFDKTMHFDTQSMEQLNENSQTCNGRNSEISQHTTDVGESEDERSMVGVSMVSDNMGCTNFADDRPSSPDESIYLDFEYKGEGDLELNGAPSSVQMEELLKPPALARVHTFETLLKGSENKSQWLRDVERTPGSNVIEEWNNMARRLREWQRNEVETEDEGEPTIESTADTKTEKKRPLQNIPEEDKNFRGGVDGPIDISKDVGSLGVMRNVPMLEESYCDETTGLPAQKYTVVSSTDGCLYTFLIRARKSSLPNAGNGLFLKFLGAKEVKPSKWKRRIEINDRRPFVFDPYEELQARHPEGFGIDVDVAGEHVKSQYNSHCLLPKLKAVLPKSGCFSDDGERTTVVTLSDPDLPYDEDELEGLRKPEKYIGHFRLFAIDDYVDAPRRKFSSLHPECGFVDIGRYGPFRKEDRKPELHFQAKSFIFGFEPSMWGFGVQETLWGREQMVDITDDLTGEPHEIAQQHLPMYVNEVGHADLEETVHACEENDRVIKYFFVVRKPMKKGEELELFVNYRSAYESNRERKGYGKKNLADKEKSDDHFPSRLMRNFVEREHLILDVEETKMCDFAMVIEFCANLAQPLHNILNDFMRCASSSLPIVSPILAKQVVAVRRLDWISSIFKARLDEMRNPGYRPAYELGPVDEHFNFQCTENLPRVVWGKWSEFFSVMEKNAMVQDRNGTVIWDELCREAMEEICFEVRKKIVLPFDESRWCPIAVEVTQNLCVATAKSLWSQGKSTSVEMLSQEFLEIAKKAAHEITGQAQSARLAFNKDFEDLFVFGEPGIKDIVGKGEQVVVTKKTLAVGDESDKSVSPVLIGVRTACDDSKDKREDIHTTWYLARQVFFLVDTMAQFALASAYSRELLATIIGLDVRTASLAVAKAVVPRRGSRTDENKFLRYKAMKQTGNKNRKGEGIKSKGASPNEKSNSPLFWKIIWPALKDEHGWTLIHGNRPHDFYACPRDVVRGQAGFRNRIDYFDSVPLIINFIKTDPTWSTNPGVQRILDEYYKCLSLYEKIKGTKAMPKFGDRNVQIEWLREQVK